MKVLVVLALAVAIVQAGFTGSLNQQVAPHLQQAMQQIRAGIAAKAPARSSAEVAFQAKFIQGIQEHIQSQIDNIQSVMDNAHVMAQQMVADTQTAIAQMQQPGADVHQIVSNWIANIMGMFNTNGRASNPVVESILNMILGNHLMVSQITASPVYQYLKERGVTITRQMLKEINDNPNGWNEFLDDPVVVECIDHFGGLTQMIRKSEMVQGIVAMVRPMGMSGLITNLVTSRVEEPERTQILTGLGLNSKSAPRALPAALQSIVGLMMNNQVFLSQVTSSAPYQCLKVGGIVVTYGLIQQVNGNPNGWNELLDDPIVVDCIAQFGGLTQLIRESEMVQGIVAMVRPMGMSGMITNLITSRVEEPERSQIIEGLGINTKSASRAISPAMQMMIGQFIAANPQVIAMVKESEAYKCLEKGNIIVTLDMVQQTTAAHGWNDFLADPVVQDCIEEQDGLTHMISSSEMINALQAVLSSLSLESVIIDMINNNVDQPWSTQMIQGLGLGRGFFSNIGNVLGNVGSAIGNVASNVWDNVSGAASSAWDGVTSGAGYVASLASAALSSALNLETLKKVVKEFLLNGTTGLASMAASQALEMMVAMAPHAAALGDMWTTAVGVYEAAHGVLNLVGLV